MKRHQAKLTQTPTSDPKIYSVRESKFKEITSSPENIIKKTI